MRKALATAAIVAAVASSHSGCGGLRPRKTSTPPPPVASARPFAVETLSRPPSPPPEVPAPPELEPLRSEVPSLPDWLASLPTFPPPPQAPPPVLPLPPPAQPPATRPPVEVPRLRQLLDAATLRAYHQEIDLYLGRVRDLLQALSHRRLNAEQQRVVAQVRALANQAARMRDNDPIASRNLAQRADLLARDLWASLK